MRVFRDALAYLQLRIERFTRGILRDSLDKKDMEHLCRKPCRLREVLRYCAMLFFSFKRCINAEEVVVSDTGKFGIGKGGRQQPFGIV